MNKELIRETVQKEIINGIKKELDSALIFTYIQSLEQENNQLKQQKQELRSWLKEETKKGGPSIDLSIRIHTIQEVLTRLEGKND